MSLSNTTLGCTKKISGSYDTPACYRSRTKASDGDGVFGEPPLSFAEHRSQCRESSRDRVRARAALCAAGELVSRPVLARSAGDRAKCARRSDRGGLPFGYFSLAEQRKVTRPRCGNRKYKFNIRHSRVARIKLHGAQSADSAPPRAACQDNPQTRSTSRPRWVR